jgi:hypothetical protein
VEAHREVGALRLLVGERDADRVAAHLRTRLEGHRRLPTEGQLPAAARDDRGAALLQGDRRRPKVTGWVPNLLLSRTRHAFPPTLGCTTIRSVWSCACSSVKAYSSSGCSDPGATSPGGPGCATA